MRRWLAVICAANLLGGCASRGTVPATNAPPDLRALAPQSAAAASHRRARLLIRIRIPKHHRRGARYISAATKGMTMKFAGPSTYTQVVNLTPSDPRCSGAPLTCTIPVTLFAGSYKASVSTFDKAPVAGAIPASASLLSTAANVPLTMTGGITNRLGVTLDGVVASLVVSSLPSAKIGTAFGSPRSFTVTAMDADGDVIAGAYDNAVTLSNGDRSGATTISTSGSDSPTSGELLSSSDTAAIAYDGAALVSATIGATASGATPAHGTFAPAPVLAAISTTTGLIGTGVRETLTGAFVPGSTTVSAGTGVTVYDVTVGATSITANFFIDPSAATGPQNVTVSTPAATSAAQTLTISDAGVIVVHLGTDLHPAAPPGTDIIPHAGGGDLRYAILNAAPGDTIVFDTSGMCSSTACTITLGGPLPAIDEDLTIDGGMFNGTPRITIDGNSSYRAFWAKSGTVSLANLQVQNVLAQGGAGGGGVHGAGGGGGAGLGAGVFIDGANVWVTNDFFSHAKVAGGQGGAITGGADAGAGGGGIGGVGGGDGGSDYGAGGGGITGDGQDSQSSVGGNGGDGFTTTGGNGANGSLGAAGANGGYGGGGGGGALNGAFLAVGGAGGSGGFGGGGAGGGFGDTPGNAGNGGFGGGGGGCAGAGCSAGAGGPGGGGGSGTTPGAGGTIFAPIAGGAGDGLGYGGGGAAAGTAVFVNTGTLTTTNSGASNLTATAGSAGGGSAGAGVANSAAVFNFSGTVNGSTAKGAINSAFGSNPPSRRHRHAALRSSHDARIIK
jgi:hypothetical protein